MATLARQVLVEAGIVPAYAAATSGGDQVDNSDGRTFLHVKNGSGGSINVTIAEQIPGTTVEDPALGTLSKSSVVKAVAAAGEAILGPFKKSAFNDANNFLQITYSSATSVTIGAFKFP